MQFEQLLDNYADLLISYALNVQPGQVVHIQGEVIHRDFIFRCARQAYEKGAKYVGIDFIDPYVTRLRLQKSASPDFLKYVPPFVQKKFNDVVDQQEVLLRLIGSEAPDILVDVDPKAINTLNFSYRNGIRRFYDEGIARSLVQWTIASAATPAWAKKVLPHLSEEEGLKELWHHILKICRVDQPHYIEAWIDHNQKLKQRAAQLTNMKIRELHFQGPETDLKVGLTPLAVFRGGGDKNQAGFHFEPNVPTEECFTTPDWRLTEGYVKTTRPFLLNGAFVEDLKMVFKEGRIVDFSASRGEKTFQEYIDSDVGARQVGEVALVGIDSPIYQSGLVFQETLLDENAACHIAIGMAYRFCLEGGSQMNEEELKNLGCNMSNVHSDMMISSENVNVTATTFTEEQITLIHQGRWAI